MKVSTRLREVNKIGYLDSEKKPLNALNTSNMESFTIDPMKGETPLDHFVRSQDPVVSLFRGFLKGIFSVARFVFYSLGFIIPFWLILGLFD